jgi:hypothetical protein
MNAQTYQHHSGRPYLQQGGFYFHPDTPEAVARTIIRAHQDGARVRLFYGDTGTGEAWAEEHDVTGTIGRSMGPVRAPLLIANRRSMGGPALLDHCIVAVIRTDGAALYKHPTFTPGEWTTRPGEYPDTGAACFEALRNGELYARSATEDRAKRFAAFMAGKRFSK